MSASNNNNLSVLEGQVENLKIKSIIGFDGTTLGGLRLHPDGHHVIFPMGNRISILHWENKNQEFLVGHTNVISAIDISKSGKYIGSGQLNHIGFKTMVIIWIFETREILTKHELHKVRIESVAFSRTDKYFMSLGGRDDSSIIVWDIESNKPLCCAPASKGCQGEATVVKVTSLREECFATGGEGTLSLWKIDPFNRKLYPVDINLSKLKRTVLCMALDRKDEVLYGGTSTGDVMKIKLNYHHDAEVLDPLSQPIMVGSYGKINECGKLPQDKIQLFLNGVRSLLIIDKNVLLIGAGNGDVALVEETENILHSNEIKVNKLIFKLPSTPQLRVRHETNCRAMVTSFVRKDKNTVFIGTTDCEIYSMNLCKFELELLVSCPTSTIYALAFPYKYSEVFATASKNDVRIWQIKTMKELLRIVVQNFTCSGVVFTTDGKLILTAWNDGIIRAFTPITGTLKYSILNAHNKGVSAIAVTADGNTIISGGCEGQIRLWDVSKSEKCLICTLKEHKGPVSCIHINKFNDEAVSASTDGTCIIWDIMRKCRKQILFANTLFMCVKYYPSGVQIVTGGSDRKIAYWEVYDGNLIRELEGSKAGGINAMDMAPNGSIFITGGNDQFIKLWKYEEGVATHIGEGHCAVVTTVNFSPNGKYIVSGDGAGNIIIWECPIDVITEEVPKVDQEQNEAGGDSTENINELESSKEETSKKRVCTCNRSNQRSNKIETGDN